MPDLDPTLSADEARAIARDAYVWGFPLVDNYRILHAYFVDRSDPEYKGPWNAVHPVGRVFTPEDTAIQSPNSDTPYAFLGADLRAEPLALTFPEMPDGRYWSAQCIDLSTHNFAYAGTRTTGNGGGTWLLAGPDWSGETPPGIDGVLACETELAFVLYRTQLLDPADIDTVRRIQAGYRAQPLSAWLGDPAPPPAPAIDFPPPLDPEAQRSSLAFFDELGFVLRFCPEHPDDAAIRARLARLGVGPGMRFDPEALPTGIREAIAAGMADAWRDIDDLLVQTQSGYPTSGDLYGSRAFMGDRFLHRMFGAAMGIYGNSKEEASYPGFTVDAAGNPLDGAAHRYRLRFGPGQLPPVDAFWSLTLYRLPEKLLFANPLDRYLVNSAMLPGLRRDDDGGLSILVQHDSPGAGWEANWLPAPAGPFFLCLRMYLPRPEAQDGEWELPPLLTEE